ncbi:hypothetical protein RDABS01_002324 [Bienertia sinuspersici]
MHIWQDGWIPTMPRFRPLPRGVMKKGMPTYVSELIEKGRWKEEVLRNIFSMWEIEEITKIPLPAFAKSDLAFCKRWLLHSKKLDSKKVRQNSFKEWCYSLISNFRLDEWWNIFWSILWGIWLQRNAWVFERKKRDAMDVIKKAIGVVGEYIQANEEAKPSYNDNRSPSKWHTPGVGYYKVNADAAMLEKKRVGMGAVMRDREGDVMASTCKQVLGEYDVEVAEALAARHALQVALEIGLTKIILEVDNLKLCQYLKDKKEPTGFGKIVQDIKVLASQCTDISFSHVKREGNKVAHHLAKLSGNFGG